MSTPQERATLLDVADLARAADLDSVHVEWSMQSVKRGTFGRYAITALRVRGVEVVPAAAVAPAPSAPTLAEVFDGHPLRQQAAAMSIADITDLLAALGERDLRWIPGTNGECGTLLEGQPEPPDLHVVFDAFRCAWQRDDDLAGISGDPCARWFGPNGRRQPWNVLQRDLGPLTPEAGIAPTTPQDQP